MSDLHELTAAEQSQALQRREISSRELTEHYLDRIARLDAELGAFVIVEPDLALEAAAEADRRLANDDGGPLCGIPIGIKDLAATAGLATSLGSAPLAGQVPPADSWTVAALRRTGTVFVGKTNTPEFGATCYTENAVTPRPSVTPYATGRYSSGSSGGAATAVAAGLLPFAHASDGAGSIRTPAATCHLVGVKPTRGLVSTAPTSSYFSTSIEGPLARTVGDAALLLDAMAEPWPGDLHGWRSEVSFADAARRGTDDRLRIAVWTETGLDDVHPHPEASRAAQRTADLLRDLGHDVREVSVPVRYDESVRHAIKAWFAAAVALAVPMLMPAEEHDRLHPYTRHLLAAGQALTGPETMLVHAVLARYASECLAALDEFDLAVTPTTSGPPVPIGHYDLDGVDGIADRMLAWSCYTPWVNLTGQPAISLPSHLDEDGLPYGVHLVGRPRHDAQLLALAGRLEHEALWESVHPPHWHR